MPEVGWNHININAIRRNKPEILVMLFGENLSLSSASNVLADRPLSGYKDKEELLSHPELANLPLSNSALYNIKFKSDFYRLTTKVDNFQYPFVLDSFLQILETGKVRVFMRSQGVF